MIDIDIEKLIPHRDSMRLIEEILELDDNHCITASTVSSRWPLYEDGYVHPIILIELVAQTAGVNFGWHEMHKKVASGMLGWLVGIKKARFFRDRIPVDSKIIISIEDRKRDDAYAEISGTARLDSEIIGEMELQVFRPESS
jgi:predicted hotdog family 3-hydroxylacyl-ACP dehydratase